MQIIKESSIKRRIMGIKYLRILWLDKRIKELKEKISSYKRYGLILIIIFCLGSCSIPLQVTIKKDLADVHREQLEYQKEQMETEGRQMDKEREALLKSFNDSGIILKSFEKLGCSIFDIAGFLNEYGKTDIDGFCDFLAKQYPFSKWFRWALDKEVFNPAKRNYKLLLERMKNE